MARNQSHQADQEFDEKVIQISRVSKKTKGGNKMGFSVLMVVGDKKGRVGVGLGKASDVIGAIRKGVKKAKKKMIDVPLDGTTIPFSVNVRKGAAQILLKPAPRGSGVIAGGPIRAVVEAAGVRDISSKILGTSNQASNVYATFAALQQITQLVTLKGIKLRSIAEIEREEAEKVKKLQEEAKSKSLEAGSKKQEAKKVEVSSKKAVAETQAKMPKVLKPKKEAKAQRGKGAKGTK